jgi:hypothetical protein
MLGMAVKFYRGPHDGLVLEIGEIKRFCPLIGMEGEDGGRLFAMMPAPGDWDRLLRGDQDKDGPFHRLYP